MIIKIKISSFLKYYLYDKVNGTVYLCIPISYTYLQMHASSLLKKNHPVITYLLQTSHHLPSSVNPLYLISKNTQQRNSKNTHLHYF